jgi:hypothetical protein
VYPAKLSLLIKGEINTFQTTQRLKKFMSTKAALQKILKGFIQKKKLESAKKCKNEKPL